MNCVVCANPIGSAFYCALDNSGNTVLYCYDCYFKVVLDNEVPNGGYTKACECECGTKAELGQNHSSWCDLFKKEFS